MAKAQGFKLHTPKTVKAKQAKAHEARVPAPPPFKRPDGPKSVVQNRKKDHAPFTKRK